MGVGVRCKNTPLNMRRTHWPEAVHSCDNQGDKVSAVKKDQNMQIRAGIRRKLFCSK